MSENVFKKMRRQVEADIAASPDKIAAIYGRVSTKTQSCILQMNEARTWCGRQGLTVYEEYEDWGLSGRKANRPALNKLMEDARAGKFKIVVVYKLCRFGRNVLDVINNILELDAIGVRFVSVTQGIDTNDKSPMARFMLQLLAALAQLEVDITQERIIDGVEHAKKYGTRSGKPIGPPRKIFSRDRVLKMREEGLSIREIAKTMNLGIGTIHRVCSATYPDQNGRA
jgi:putative DNA-invertase from lambdoid prophage Rac